jgi:adenylate cyclase
MLVMAIFLWLGILQPLEWMAYNKLFQLRGAVTWDERIVLVTIDDPSLRAFGQFPWSRERYIQLLNVLDTAQPNVLAFDLIFSESSTEDTLFAQAIERHGRVVLAQAWDNNGDIWLPISKLQQAASITGHILTSKDADGMVRKILPQIKGIPSFEIAALKLYSTFAEVSPFPDLKNPIWINWVSKIQDMPHYSFVDVVQNRIAMERFKNKIVLVGVTAPGIDSLITPFDYDPPTGGVYVYATSINTFLQRQVLQLFSPGAWVILLLLGGTGLSWLIYGWQIRQKLALFVGLCIAWGFLTVLMLKLNYWLPVAAPIGLFGMTTGCVILHHHLKVRAENQSLQRLAYYDGLTQIPNRRRCDQYLLQEWRHMNREKSFLSLILCDVDFFKRYNDTYGHQAGDACLKKVAQAVSQSIKRPSDLVARYGGEEFVVILPHTDVDGAILIAEEIRSHVQALAITHEASQVSQQVTLSLGIASTIPTSDITPELLLKAADEALYRAKEQGRDRFVAATHVN